MRKIARLSFALLLPMCFYGCTPSSHARRTRVEKAQATRNAMEEILDSKTSVFFTETPLSQVLAFMADSTGIDLVSPRNNTTDPLITIRVNDMTLRDTLNWIAILSGTKWKVRGDTIRFKKRTGTLKEDTKERDLAQMKTLEESLDTKKVSLFFTETPLSSIMQFLGDLTDTDYVVELDDRDDDRDVDPLITLRVNSMTLRSALNWIAVLSDTRWRIRYEAVWFYRPGPRKQERRRRQRQLQPVDNESSASTARNEKIEDILNTKKVHVFFTHTPLCSILQFLSDLLEVDFVLHPYKRNAPAVTLRVEKMRLRSLLNLITKETQYEWDVRDEVVYFQKIEQRKKIVRGPLDIPELYSEEEIRAHKPQYFFERFGKEADGHHHYAPMMALADKCKAGRALASRIIAETIRVFETEKDADLRRRYVGLMIQIGDKRFLPVLLDALRSDTDADVREQAAFSLFRFRAFLVLEDLEKVLEGEEDGKVAGAIGGVIESVRQYREFVDKSDDDAKRH